MSLETRLSGAISRRFDSAETVLRGAGRGLLHPAELIGRQTQHLDMLTSQLHAKIERHLGDRQIQIARLADRLPAPSERLGKVSDRLSTASVRLDGFVDQKLATLLQNVSGLDRLLQANSFERVLDRGFALITSDTGQTVKRAADLPAGADVQIRFADAVRAARLEGDQITKDRSEGEAARPKSPKKSAAKPAKDAGQTELF